MKGIILGFDVEKGSGVIRGDDGKRYRFLNGQWMGADAPKAGVEADFEVQDEEALEVYPLDFDNEKIRPETKNENNSHNKHAYKPLEANPVEIGWMETDVEGVYIWRGLTLLIGAKVEVIGNYSIYSTHNKYSRVIFTLPSGGSYEVFGLRTVPGIMDIAVGDRGDFIIFRNDLAAVNSAEGRTIELDYPILPYLRWFIGNLGAIVGGFGYLVFFTFTIPCDFLFSIVILGMRQSFYNALAPLGFRKDICSYYDMPGVQHEKYERKAMEAYKAGRLNRAKRKSRSKRIPAVLSAWFFGWLGFHKFYIGKFAAGLVMLAVTLLGAYVMDTPVPGMIVEIVAIIEGMIWLFKSNEDFQRLYVEGDKAWF